MFVISIHRYGKIINIMLLSLSERDRAMDRKIVQKVSELRNMLQESSSEEGDERRQYMLGIVDEIIDFVDAGHGSQDSIYQSIIHKLAQEDRKSVV